MHSKSYNNLAAAIDACAKLGTSCGGVNDPGCDGRANFYLCKDAGFRIGSNTCVYTLDRPGWSEVLDLSITHLGHTTN